MAITDLAKATEAGVPWRMCSTCHALTTLPPKEAAALRALLANPAVRYNELSAALAADEDYPLRLSPGNLSRHARGQCDARDALRSA